MVNDDEKKASPMPSPDVSATSEKRGPDVCVSCASPGFTHYRGCPNDPPPFNAYSDAFIAPGTPVAHGSGPQAARGPSDERPVPWCPHTPKHTMPSDCPEGFRARRDLREANEALRSALSSDERPTFACAACGANTKVDIMARGRHFCSFDCAQRRHEIVPTDEEIKAVFYRECKQRGLRVNVYRSTDVRGVIDETEMPPGVIDLGTATDGGTLVNWYFAGDGSYEDAFYATRVHFGLPARPLPQSAPISDADSSVRGPGGERVCNAVLATNCGLLYGHAPPCRIPFPLALFQQYRRMYRTATGELPRDDAFRDGWFDGVRDALTAIREPEVAPTGLAGAISRIERMLDCPGLPPKEKPCTLPPPGWECSRGFHADGPCAARPTKKT